MGLSDKLKEQDLNGFNELQDKVNNVQNQQSLVTPPPVPQPQMTPTPAPQQSQSGDSGGIYGDYMERLIDMALADGELTEKEKQILFKKAEANGIDLDEFEMVLNAKLFEAKKAAGTKSNQKEKEETSAPRSDKFGDIRKCPSCGAILQSFQTHCDECGYEFKNVNAVQSARKLFDLLQAAELRKSEQIGEQEKEKARRLDQLAKIHNSDSGFVKVFGGSSRKETQDEEREDLIREMNAGIATIEQKAIAEKANIIKNFPVPNSKEDLMELLAMATSSAYDNDGVIGKEEEVWIQKTDQIYQKIIICAKNDPSLLDQSTHMVVSLMKRLPKPYKKFTQIPQSIQAKVQAELQAEKDAKKNLLIKTLKKYGMYAIAPAIALFISIILIANDSGFGIILLFISVAALVIIYKLFMKEYRSDNYGLI